MQFWTSISEDFGNTAGSPKISKLGSRSSGRLLCSATSCELGCTFALSSVREYNPICDLMSLLLQRHAKPGGGWGGAGIKKTIPSNCFRVAFANPPVRRGINGLSAEQKFIRVARLAFSPYLMPRCTRAMSIIRFAGERRLLPP
jgi:hypothetical protein